MAMPTGCSSGRLTSSCWPEVIGENALLGNRAVPLVVMAAVAAGWVRWRYLPSRGRTRRGLTLMVVAIGLVGLLGLGAIGNARGAPSSPSRHRSHLASQLEDPVNIVAQVGNSAEKVASHMSLVGVLEGGHCTPRIRSRPTATRHTPSSFRRRRTRCSPSTRYAAWWLRVGPFGVLLAGLSGRHDVGAAPAAVVPPRGAVFTAFALPASTLPAAGLPIIMLRSGPEAVRSVVIELLLIPALALLPATLFTAERSTVRPPPRRP